MRILIVEDDESVASFIKQAIEEDGHESEIAQDGLIALDKAKSEKWDIILLDVMLPEIDGYQVCSKLRQSGFNTPIMIITAKDSYDDKIKGLDSGADDYIVKPFFVGELLARIRALGRRAKTSSSILKVSDLTLNSTTHEATRQNISIVLSRTEFVLLEYLMRNKGKLLSRSVILDHVWKYDFEGKDNVLDVYINYLRKKIDKGFKSQLIHTVRGSGYWFGVKLS